MLSQDAIKIIKEILNDNGHDGWHDDAKTAFNVAIASLESPHWTPCAEGMPDVQTDVHVTVRQCNGQISRTEAYVHRFDSKWHYAKTPLSVVIGEVIAWSQYPAPYRADDTAGKVKEDADNGTEN